MTFLRQHGFHGIIDNELEDHEGGHKAESTGGSGIGLSATMRHVTRIATSRPLSIAHWIVEIEDKS
ncbi:hypothetical protein OUZ56_031404 [Daphnia magna]|uniref:Uncharacterized protein n=1 Tax=Daphnia magna TaxID=35525 RepID=A0ABQ9ZUY5_9CRUS|nr:hypothetical protein OUZ56_031404 [Daphnia magna]